jgi:cytoskeletal protein CcmA (bactofilin family)
MKSKSDGSSLNGFIDRGSQFEGELRFEETFRIDGKFEGKIHAGAELILGETADVTAEITVKRLSVNGTVRGTIRASDRIELLAHARVTGDISTPILKIEEGAQFRGTCQMGHAGELDSNVVDLADQRK